TDTYTLSLHDALPISPTSAPRESRHGVQIVPDQTRSSRPAPTRLPAMDRQPARALDLALHAIGARYGAHTTDFVAMQLEYPAGRSEEHTSELQSLTNI